MSFLSSVIGHPAERVAIVDQQDFYTYGELVLQARHLAATLKDEGVNQGEVVAYLADNGVWSVIAMLGIWLAEAVAMPFDSRLGPVSLREKMHKVKGRCVVRSYHPIEDGFFQRALDDLKWVSTVTKHKNPLPLKLTRDESRALLLFTESGSAHTSPVVITFSALSARARLLAQTWGVEPNDHMMHLLSMAKMSGISSVLCAMAAGATCKLCHNSEEMGERIVRDSSELLVVDEQAYGDLLGLWQSSAIDFKSKKDTRLVVISETPQVSEIGQHWCQLTGVTQMLGFGLVESGMVLSMDISEQHPDALIGVPLSGVSIRIVSDSGKPLTSSVGELEVRSPQLFSGYAHEDTVNTDVFHHGWFKTDIIAFKQPDGCYQLVGE
ncbi:AMP-binding protein [Endozoicomonas sp.]|nr:AMP-binding protein [Endozoicomonas sp.]